MLLNCFYWLNSEAIVTAAFIYHWIRKSWSVRTWFPQRNEESSWRTLCSYPSVLPEGRRRTIITVTRLSWVPPGALKRDKFTEKWKVLLNPFCHSRFYWVQNPFMSVGTKNIPSLWKRIFQELRPIKIWVKHGRWNKCEDHLLSGSGSPRCQGAQRTRS